MLQSLWPQILTKLRSPPPGVNLGSLPSMLGGFDKVVFENSTPSDKPTALGFVSNKDANQNGKIDSIHFVIPNIEKALREQGVKLSSSADLEGENLHKLLFFFGHLLSHELAHIKDYQHGADSPFPGGENPAEQKAREFESQFRVAANIRKSIDTVYRGSNMNSKFSGKSIANNSKLAASGKNFISKTARLLKKADADFGQSFPDEMLPYVDETDPASLPENISPTLPEEKSAPSHGMAPAKPAHHPISKTPAPKPNETIREIQKLLDMPKQNGLWDADATQGYWRHFIDENYNGKFKNVIRENWAAGAASLGYEKTPEGMLNFMKNIELEQIAQPRPAGSLPEPVTTAGLNKKFISKKAQFDSYDSFENEKPEEIFKTYDDFEGTPKSPSAKHHSPKHAPLKSNSLLVEFQQLIGASQPFESKWGPSTDRAWKNFINTNIANDDHKLKIKQMPWGKLSDPKKSASHFVSFFIGKTYTPDLRGILEFAKDLKNNSQVRNLFNHSDEHIDTLNLNAQPKEAVASSKRMISKRAQANYSTIVLTPEQETEANDKFAIWFHDQANNTKIENRELAAKKQQIRNEIYQKNLGPMSAEFETPLDKILQKVQTPEGPKGFEVLKKLILDKGLQQLATYIVQEAGVKNEYYFTINDSEKKINLYKRTQTGGATKIEKSEDVSRILSLIAENPKLYVKSVAKKPSHQKLHEIQKALGVQESKTWDDATKKAWEKLIDDKYLVDSKTGAQIPLQEKNYMKASWKESAAKVNQQATQDGILAFIKELKDDKYTAKTPEAKAPEANPVDQGAAPPAAKEPAKDEITVERLKSEIQELVRRPSPLSVNGREILSAESVYRRANNYVQKLGGEDSAARTLASNPGLSYFKDHSSNRDQLRYEIFSELERLRFTKEDGRVRLRGRLRQKKIRGL